MNTKIKIYDYQLTELGLKTCIGS